MEYCLYFIILSYRSKSPKNESSFYVPRDIILCMCETMCIIFSNAAHCKFCFKVKFTISAKQTVTAYGDRDEGFLEFMKCIFLL